MKTKTLLLAGAAVGTAAGAAWYLKKHWPNWRSKALGHMSLAELRAAAESVAKPRGKDAKQS